MTTRIRYICDLGSHIRLNDMYPCLRVTQRLEDLFFSLGFSTLPGDDLLDSILLGLSDVHLTALGWIFEFEPFCGASLGGLCFDEDAPGETPWQTLPEPDAGWMAHRLDALADKAGW